MSHVHGAKTVAGVGSAKTTDSAMAASTSSMMSEAMASIIKKPAIAKGAVGAAASAGSSIGKTVIGNVFKHPLALFSLGVALGYYVCKYRQSIVSAAGQPRR